MNRVILTGLLLWVGACDVFDESLYQGLEDGGHHHDAGDLPVLALADRCTAGQGTTTADNACPSFDDTALFAHDLSGGTHYLRVTTVNDEPVAVGYRLSIEVLAGS